MKTYERKPVLPLKQVQAERWLGIGFLTQLVKPYTGWQTKLIPSEKCSMCGRDWKDHGEVSNGEGKWAPIVHPGWYIFWTDDGWKVSSREAFEKTYRQID